MTKCIYLVIVVTLPFVTAEIERSFLDDFLPLYRKVRLGLFDQQLIHSQANSYRRTRMQDITPQSTPFPCDLNATRSPQRPKSVHKLRPGDIDVIGALGDSLTAGFGISSTDLMDVALEERGKVFSIGGQGTWKEFLTLPNILKNFNPDLIGFSLGPSLTIQRASQFNVAEAGAVSDNLPYMAKILIRRITRDPRVNLKDDWKMITVLIGDNDFCSDMCYHKDPRLVLDKHRKDMITVLRLLRDNLPRTIVNLVVPPSIKILMNLRPKPSQCELVLRVVCPCFFGSQFHKSRLLYYELMRKWQEIDLQVAQRSEFDLDDFAVVALPFFMNYTFPKVGNDDNFDLLSADCFHFSQKGTSNGFYFNRQAEIVIN